MSNVQKFLANEGGIHKRRLDIRPIPSATCPRESVLPIRLRPDFSVVFEGYAGGAEHWPRRRHAGSQRLDRRHHGAGRPGRTRGDLPPHQGRAGRRQGPRDETRKPQRRRRPETRRQGRGGLQGGRHPQRRRPRRSHRAGDRRPAAAGHTALRAIAAELEARGIKTRREGRWQVSTVRNLLARIERG